LTLFPTKKESGWTSRRTDGLGLGIGVRANKKGRALYSLLLKIALIDPLKTPVPTLSNEEEKRMDRPMDQRTDGWVRVRVRGDGTHLGTCG